MSSAQIFKTYPQCGTVTLNGATPVLVPDAGVTANSVILLCLKTAQGTPAPAGACVSAVVAGTSFSVVGVALDTSVYNYIIFN
jgi:hypothetical protein